MFKDFLEKKLEDKGKQIEQRSKLDKEVVQLKFKGNQKQFELNAELGESESIEPHFFANQELSQEGKQRIRKQQKLIKIADKSRNGWQVVAKYESDELVSGSEDEKRLKKAREAASRKRRQKEPKYLNTLYLYFPLNTLIYLNKRRFSLFLKMPPSI